MFDHKALLLVAGLQLLGLCSGKQLEFFKSGLSPARNLDRRQTAPPGYHPEFGACGSGTSCENACGANWLSCTASTDLSLFCYNNVDFGQTCCENGSGRACDRGYYCAWQTFGGRVWCCEDVSCLFTGIKSNHLGPFTDHVRVNLLRNVVFLLVVSPRGRRPRQLRPLLLLPPVLHQPRQT